jgi:GTP-binding protein YchF
VNISTAITGMAKSGRTTIFNALTRGHADIGSYSVKNFAPHIGIAKVPEPRFTTLRNILHPEKFVPAELRYLDISASVKELAQDDRISGQLLNQISAADALITVIRAFHDESLPHPKSSLDIDRDLTTMELELTFADLETLDKRLSKIDISLKGAKQHDRQHLLREQDILMRLKMDLEEYMPIRELTLSEDDTKFITNYQFLSAKPQVIVINIGEDQLSEANSLEVELNSRYSKNKCRIITLCGKLEMEISQLDNGTAEEYRSEYGIIESGLERIIKASYDLLGLISFFSIASREVRAWPIKNGTGAQRAAGKIHSDMERGFIRAEVISYDDLVKCGSLPESRKKGLIRLEGKNYSVQDGDIITFLFNT